METSTRRDAKSEDVSSNGTGSTANAQAPEYAARADARGVPTSTVAAMLCASLAAGVLVGFACAKR
jgi:hypothetical protein